MDRKTMILIGGVALVVILVVIGVAGGFEGTLPDPSTWGPDR